MPNWLMVCGGHPETIGSGNRYCGLVGYLQLAQNEAYKSFVVRDSYTCKELLALVLTNTRDGACTVLTRVAGGDGNQLVTIPATTTGEFRDSVNSDSLVDGNTICCKTTRGGSSGSCTLNTVSTILETAANEVPILGGLASQAVNANLTRYLSIFGYNPTTTAEAIIQYRFRTASTLSDLRVYVSANTVTAASTVKIRIDGGDGNQIVSIIASTTGAFEDTGNTDAIAAGELVNAKLVTGATGTSLTLESIGLKSSSIRRQVVSGNPGSSSQDFGSTKYTSVEANCQDRLATEAEIHCLTRIGFIAKNLYAYSNWNGVDGATTIKLRKSGGDSGLSITVPDSTSGTFEDLVGEGSIAEADRVSYQVVTGGSSSSMRFTVLGFELEQPAAVGLENKSANMGAKMVAAGVL